MDPSAERGPLVADKTAKQIDGLLAKISPSKDLHPDDQLREGIRSIVLSLAVESNYGLQSEEFADAVSMLSLIKEGRIEVSDLGRFAQYRLSTWRSDPVHDTSSLLINIEKRLQQDPELVRRWQREHREAVATKGLQIGDVVDWVSPLWKAHAALRNDKEQLAVKSTVVDVPETQVQAFAKSTRTASYFSSLLKKTESAPRGPKFAP